MKAALYGELPDQWRNVSDRTPPLRTLARVQAGSVDVRLATAVLSRIILANPDPLNAEVQQLMFVCQRLQAWHDEHPKKKKKPGLVADRAKLAADLFATLLVADAAEEVDAAAEEEAATVEELAAAEEEAAAAEEVEVAAEEEAAAAEEVETAAEELEPAEGIETAATNSVPPEDSLQTRWANYFLPGVQCPQIASLLRVAFAKVFALALQCRDSAAGSGAALGLDDSV